MKTILIALVMAVVTVGCGAGWERAAGSGSRLPVPEASEPAAIGQPIDARTPASDDLVFTPVPIPAQPPSPKPVRPLPTPPPDRPIEEPTRDVESAIADLAIRLDIPPPTIEVLDARSVTWRDGSVGCPEDGLAYTQAEVPGILIVLRADDASFRYHAATDGPLFLCETPQSPIEGSA